VDLAGRTLLGKYRIEGLIGQGGMGTVWKGAHVVTARKVAIKVLDPRFLSNVAVVQRFGREARAASAVQHEGIVEVLDLDQTEEGLPFLVMEFLEGESLSKRVEKRGRLSQEETVRVGSLLLEALAAAHEHGVVHRDLKPDNIFLVPAGRRGEILKILDFGISHKDDEAQAKLTMTGSVLGTPHYMSPEQAMGETNLDRRVDIYGVGVVLYECLVGDVPFDAPNYNKLLRVILDDDAAPPSKRGAVVDPRFEKLVLRTLSKNRDERPQTAREMLEQLKASVAEGGDRPSREFGRDAAPHARTASAGFPRPEGPGARAGAVPPANGPRGDTPGSSAAAARSWQDAPLAAVAAAPARAQIGAEVAPPKTRTPVAPAPPAAKSGHLDAPAISPASPASTNAGRTGSLKLDAPVGGGALGAFDDLDADHRPVALEIDEAALARPPSKDASISGMHRALPGGAAPAQRSTPTSVRPRDAAADPAAPRGAAEPGAPLRDRVAASRSSDAIPAMRPGPGRTSIPPQPAAPDKPPGIAGWWQSRPEPVRRWAPIGVLGLVAFVAVVGIVRALVRPGGDPNATSTVTTPVATPETHLPEWVLVEVDGLPPSAQLRLDGLPGATVPLRVRRDARHVLEIRAAGYEDRRIEFTAHEDLRLRADLRPAIGTHP
jgi:serine/threonine-protein kinase